MNIELRHLRYFVAVAEELHFGRAAARLNISQPPLSQQIQALEQQIGARLLARTNRSVLLTAAGKQFLADSRQILSMVDDAAARADAPRDKCAHFREINGIAAAFQHLQKNYIPAALSFL